MKNVKPLLDFIAKPESGGDYNIVYGGIKAQHRPPKLLTTMSIGEVLAWQDSIDRLYMSEAAGRYQIMEDTLRGLYRSAGLALDDTFNEATQDRLAYRLLERRGLDDYLAGRISAEKFAQSLSQEWASLPCTIRDRNGRPAKGQSYYAGDGLNKSHVSLHAFMAAVRGAKVSSIEAPPRADWAPPADEVPKQGGWAALVAFLVGIFGGGK